MIGKEKCKALKEIRQKIAQENDIAYVVEECRHKGDCKGTCPKCEAELRYLERELQRRVSLGKKVAIVGLSVGVAAGMGGCIEPIDTIVDSVFGTTQLSGDAQPAPSEPLQGEYYSEPSEDIGGAEEMRSEDSSQTQLAGEMPADDSEECSEELDGDVSVSTENSFDDTQTSELFTK